MRSGRILVLAAWPPELARLRRRLARAHDLDVELRAIGVGLVAAAVGAARAIAETRPRAVLLVGTAGVYRAAPGAAIGEAIVAARTCVVSAAAATGHGYFPGPMPRERAFDGELCAALGPGRAIVGCPLAITSHVALARRIARETGAELENLEAHAFAEAAAQAGVPAAAVLGVANVVGPNAHVEWRRHASAAAAAACDVVWDWLIATVRAPSRRPRRRG